MKHVKKIMSSLTAALMLTNVVAPTVSVNAAEPVAAIDENVSENLTGKLVINEVNSQPDDWVELMNIGDAEIDISGYEIRDNSDDHRWKLPDETKIGAGELFVVDAKSIGLSYNDSTDTYEEGSFDSAIGLGGGDSVRIFDKDGNLVAEYSWSEHASYNGDGALASYGRYPDGTGDFCLMKETKGAKNDWYKPQVVINEIESKDPNGGKDWVEVMNIGQTSVDISGWYLLDNDPTGHASKVIPVADGTVLEAGQFYVFEEDKNFSFGLGKADKATVYNKAGIIVDEYEWATEAAGVYARIPDGTGDFVDFETVTKGAKNENGGSETPEEPEEKVEKLEWSGPADVKVLDATPTFLEDSSGLDFYNGKLYAIDNGTGKFWIMDIDAEGKFSFVKGFEQGKQIRFQKDADNLSAKGPDTEGITVDANGMVYAAAERDNSDKGVNYDVILMVDPNEEGTVLVAKKEWDLTKLLPEVSANMGIEAVEWASDAEANGKLFDQNTNNVYNASTYSDTLDGIFFVGLEDNGHVYAFKLKNDGSAVLIADIDSKIGGVMGLDYDTEEHVLYAAADNGYNNILAKITLNGTQEVGIQHILPPANLDVTANNEGFCIADASLAVNGLKPVFRFQDGVKSGALTMSYMKTKLSSEPVTPEVDKPQTVTNVKAATAGKNNVKITWDAVSDAEGYLIYAKKNNQYAYCGMTTSQAATSFTDTKALDEDYGFYWVFAYKKDSTDKMIAGGCEKYTYGKGVVLRVSNFKASSVKGGVKLSWTKAAQADGYLIYGINANGKYHYIGMTDKDTFIDKKASKTSNNFYWIFPYHKSASGKIVAGQICSKYVYGKAQ